MSLATVDRKPRNYSRAPGARASLIGALNTVPGLSVGSTAPDVATPGAAWPRWVQSTYNGKLCAVGADNYDVLVVLPAAQLDQTVAEGDELRDAIEPALWLVCVIEYAEPVSIGFNDQQTMPGIRFRVRV